VFAGACTSPNRHSRFSVLRGGRIPSLVGWLMRSIRAGTVSFLIAVGVAAQTGGCGQQTIFVEPGTDAGHEGATPTCDHVGHCAV
jgi:hypothetical protein